MAVTFSKFKNFGRTTLAAAIDDDDLSFTVPTGTGDRLPSASSPASFPLALGSDDGGWEIVTARREAASDTVTIVARAAEDGAAYPAISHDAGVTVLNAITGKYIDELQDAVNGMLDGSVVFDRVTLGDDDELRFGVDNDFKFKYDSVDNRLEILNAADSVLARLSAAGALTLAAGLTCTTISSTTIACTGLASTGNVDIGANRIHGAQSSNNYFEVDVSGNGNWKSRGSIGIYIDSDNNATTADFQIFKDASTLVFSIDESAGARFYQDLVVDLDFACNGGDFTSSATTFNLLAQPTTVNAFAGASAALNIGHASAKAALLGGLSIADGKNVALGTTTGTKWGESASAKQAWWNATPVVQPSFIAAPTGMSVHEDVEARAAINAIRSLLSTTGLMAAA